jgi:hypothetical protein
MAHFHRTAGERISNTTVVVDGDSITIGLWGPKDFQGHDLAVTNDTDNLSILPAGRSGDSALFNIRVRQAARATHKGLSDTIYAVTDRLEVWDRFKIEFRFKDGPSPAADLVVRDVTKEVYGVDEISNATSGGSIVNVTTFKAGDPRNVLDFVPRSGCPVRLKLFASKIGTVERTYWLMLPREGAAQGVMIVISHGFGQGEWHYGPLGYNNPFSKPFLDDVKLRFVLARWGMQLAFLRPQMGLLMPVRAKGGTGGGTELGPFVSQSGLGTRIVNQIAALSHADFLLKTVGVVTFSSGVYDANTFIRVGGHGLPFALAVNQDPAGGMAIAGGGMRRQYLSGYTTGGPRPGFEYLPDPRWIIEPQRTAMKAQLGREYLHTWAVPTYTLALALS